LQIRPRRANSSTSRFEVNVNLHLGHRLDAGEKFRGGGYMLPFPIVGEDLRALKVVDELQGEGPVDVPIGWVGRTDRESRPFRG
jgi:hypothetical protein